MINFEEQICLFNGVLYFLVDTELQYMHNNYLELEDNFSLTGQTWR